MKPSDSCILFPAIKVQMLQYNYRDTGDDLLIKQLRLIGVILGEAIIVGK